MAYLPTMGVREDVFFSTPRPGLGVRRRAIAAGDEAGLLAAEAAGFAASALAVRQRSGAARIAAREIFKERFGLLEVAIPRAADRSPIWPQGFVGSLAHDELMAVAVVGRAADYASVGIDIEPNEALDPDLVALVASPAEIRRYAPAVLQSRLLFVIKEATYKALFPLDKLFLDFSDIEVDLERLQTRTTQGRTTAVTLCVAAHIAALCVPI